MEFRKVMTQNELSSSTVEQTRKIIELSVTAKSEMTKAPNLYIFLRDFLTYDIDKRFPKFFPYRNLQ